MQWSIDGYLWDMPTVGCYTKIISIKICQSHQGVTIFRMNGVKTGLSVAIATNVYTQ